MAAELPATFSRQRLFFTIAIFVLGYVIAFIDAYDSGESYSLFQLILIIGSGVLYTYIHLVDEKYLDQTSKRSKKIFYFALQLLLLGLIQFLFGPVNGVWLLGMPLIGTAVGLLPLSGQALVALLTLLIFSAPIALRYGLESGISVAFSLLSAVLFVMLFVRLWLNSEEARHQAEQLTMQLEEANRQLADYATQAEELATTHERNRLAREIHDSLGHYLTVINVQLEAAQLVLAQKPDKAQDSIQKAQQLTQEGLKAVRQSVSALRESPLGKLSLVEAIESLAEETRRAGIVTEFEVVGKERPLADNIQLTLYRVVQEGLTNVRKHARASRADITLDYTETAQIQLKIEDNGLGQDRSEREQAGFGLLGVRERVNILGGQTVIRSAAGQGFQIRVTLPLPEEEKESR